MADKNLRALAKQSWDSIFAEAYPKLAGMIRSINEEMERTLQDSSRELKTSTVAIEGFEQKLVTTKTNISSLVRSQEKMGDYLSSIFNAIEKRQGTGGPSVDLSSLTKTAAKGGVARTAVSAVAGRSPIGMGLKALLGIGALAGGVGTVGMVKDAFKDNKESGSGNSLSALSSSDSIKFVADKIIFKSAKGSSGPSGAQESGSGSTGGTGGSTPSSSPPDAQRQESSGSGGSGGGGQQQSGGGGAAGGSGGSGGGGGSGSTESGETGNTPKDETNVTMGSESGSKEKPKNVAVESGGDASRVDQNLLTSFYRAASEFGRPVTISSGFRSDEKQAQLYARWLSGESGIYMPAKPVKGATITVRGRSYNVPGGGRGSNHSKGTAIDSPQAEAMDKAGLLKKYGLSRPHAANDPVHIQLTGGSEPMDSQTTPAGTQVASSPTTGTKVNKASVEKKVETEKMQQQASSTQINNLITQSPSSQTPEKQSEKPRGREVSTRDRLGKLVSSYQSIS